MVKKKGERSQKKATRCHLQQISEWLNSANQSRTLPRWNAWLIAIARDRFQSLIQVSADVKIARLSRLGHPWNPRPLTGSRYSPKFRQDFLIKAEKLGRFFGDFAPTFVTDAEQLFPVEAGHFRKKTSTVRGLFRKWSTRRKKIRDTFRTRHRVRETCDYRWISERRFERTPHRLICIVSLFESANHEPLKAGTWCIGGRPPVEMKQGGYGRRRAQTGGSRWVQVPGCSVGLARSRLGSYRYVRPVPQSTCLWVVWQRELMIRSWLLWLNSVVPSDRTENQVS